MNKYLVSWHATTPNSCDMGKTIVFALDETQAVERAQYNVWRHSYKHLYKDRIQIDSTRLLLTCGTTFVNHKNDYNEL